MTLAELRELYEADLHAPVPPPKTETKNIYGSEDGKQIEVKEAVVVDDETGITSLQPVRFEQPCLHWATGSCLTRGLNVHACCENCWEAFQKQNHLHQFWD